MDQRLDISSLDPSLDLPFAIPASCATPQLAAPSFTDLIAASLREACEVDGDCVFPIIARLIDQHLAGTAQSRRVGRWRDEALDDLLSAVSPGVRARIGAGACAD